VKAVAYERHSKTSNPDCPSSQEPRITGNSGNTGNGLVWRGLQPLPPYKKSGKQLANAHLIFNIRAPHFPFIWLSLLPVKNRWQTVWQHRQRLEATVYGAVAIVAAVAGVFEITGTLDYRQ